MKRGVLIIALLLSLAVATDCANEFTLYEEDTKELEGDTFKLVEAADTFEGLEVTIDGEEIDFDIYYEVDEGWLVRIVSLVPDGVMLRASDIFSDQEGDEVEMNTCDRAAVEIEDYEILMMPSPYTYVRFLIDGEELIIEPAKATKQYIGENYLLELISKDGDKVEGTEEATIKLTKLRLLRARLNQKFTLVWDENAAVRLGDSVVKMLPENPYGAIMFDGEIVYNPEKGETKPINEDYEYKFISGKGGTEPEVTLIITQRPEPTPIPEPTATPEPTPTPDADDPDTPPEGPTPTPEPTVEPTPTPTGDSPSSPEEDDGISPGTGLVTQERGFIGMIIDWIVSLLGL